MPVAHRIGEDLQILLFAEFLLGFRVADESKLNEHRWHVGAVQDHKGRLAPSFSPGLHRQ